MFSCGRNCRPCSTADPSQDTVKVNAAFLNHYDKENSNGNAANAPNGVQQHVQESDQERFRRERERQAAEAAARQRALEAKEKQQRVEELRRQREQLEAEERRQREEAERLQYELEAHVAAETERKRREEELLAEARAEQERLVKAQNDDEKLKEFLATRKYAGVNDRRKSMLKSKYPLHSAVKDNDPDLVRILLQAGADPSLRNSKGKTPRQLAEYYQGKHGAHATVLHTLPFDQ